MSGTGPTATLNSGQALCRVPLEGASGFGDYCMRGGRPGRASALAGWRTLLAGWRPLDQLPREPSGASAKAVCSCTAHCAAEPPAVTTCADQCEPLADKLCTFWSRHPGFQPSPTARILHGCNCQPGIMCVLEPHANPSRTTLAGPVNRETCAPVECDRIDICFADRGQSTLATLQSAAFSDMHHQA